jgi:hypothetical protein
MSKFSFQYGFNVFLITLVVWVCSPSTVMTANGSGRRKTSRLTSESAATTVVMRRGDQGSGDGAGQDSRKQEVWRESREIVQIKKLRRSASGP